MAGNIDLSGAKLEHIGKTYGPYLVLDINLSSISNKLKDAIVSVECKKCNNKRDLKYPRIAVLKLRDKNYAEKNIFYEGCPDCSKNEMTAKSSHYQVGTKLYDGRIITKIEIGSDKILSNAVVTIYCEKCRQFHTYKYCSLFTMSKNNTQCKGCYNRSILRNSIEEYKKLVGKQFGLQKVIKLFHFGRVVANSKVLCSCIKCDAVSIKKMRNLEINKVKKITQCLKCPEKRKFSHMFTKHEDLTGLRFGIFEVLSFSHISEDENKQRLWNTRCNCGNLSLRSTGALSQIIRGNEISHCKSCVSLFNREYVVGAKFLKGLEILEVNHDTKRIKCICGNCKHITNCSFSAFHIKINRGRDFCKHCAVIKHGESKERFYRIWNIITTIFYRKNIPFDNRWQNYVNFKEDMFDSYQENFKLISDNGIWNKQHCSWVPKNKL